MRKAPAALLTLLMAACVWPAPPLTPLGPECPRTPEAVHQRAYYVIDVYSPMIPDSARAATIRGFLQNHLEVTHASTDTVEGVNYSGGIRATFGLADSGTKIHLHGLYRRPSDQVMMWVGSRDVDSAGVAWCRTVRVARSVGREANAFRVTLRGSDD